MHGLLKVELLVGVAAAVLFSASGSLSPVAGEQRVTVELVQADRRPVLPRAWRWESYGGVEAGVPGGWGWDDAARVGAWCVNPFDARPPAAVRLDGPIPAILCNGSGKRVADTGSVVAFGHAETASTAVERQDDRTTVRLAGVEVEVQAPRGVREQIAATVHRVPGGVDDYGCPTTDPISFQPALSPEPRADVSALRAVSSVSACRYELDDGFATAQRGPWLVSSLRLDGPAAAAAVRGIARAPVGGGPNLPRNCIPEAAYGDDVIVLRVRSAVGVTGIVLRYSGCDHHGFDDGVHVHRLTPAAIAPFTAGPNAVLPVFG